MRCSYANNMNPYSAMYAQITCLPDPAMERQRRRFESRVSPSRIFFILDGQSQLHIFRKRQSINHGLNMAPRLQDLIDFLLAEIALCGDQGMQATTALCKSLLSMIHFPSGNVIF